jgi:transposase InsO family protein
LSEQVCRESLSTPKGKFRLYVHFPAWSDPLFSPQAVPVNWVFTDRGTEYCGASERHEYELYLAVENIDHTRTKTGHPQANGICERLHTTMLNEFYRVTFRKKIYRTIEELRTDLDAWSADGKYQRPHECRWCYGKTPMQTFLDSVALAKEKILAV